MRAGPFRRDVPPAAHHSTLAMLARRVPALLPALPGPPGRRPKLRSSGCPTTARVGCPGPRSVHPTVHPTGGNRHPLLRHPARPAARRVSAWTTPRTTSSTWEGAVKPHRSSWTSAADRAAVRRPNLLQGSPPASPGWTSPHRSTARPEDRAPSCPARSACRPPGTHRPKPSPSTCRPRSTIYPSPPRRGSRPRHHLRGQGLRAHTLPGHRQRGLPRPGCRRSPICPPPSISTYPRPPQDRHPAPASISLRLPVHNSTMDSIFRSPTICRPLAVSRWSRP